MGLKGKRFLVTGGAGFIGGHLCEALVNAGATPVILDDFSTGNLENLEAVRNSVQVIEGSILNAEDILQAATGVDGIFHLAAEVSVPKSVANPVHVHQVNSVGTLQTVLAAQEAGVKIIFSSSAAVYGDTQVVPVQEQDPLVPISPYGVQKLNGEQYIRAFHALNGLKGVCLRYFNVYGPRQDPKSPYSGVITIFCEKSRANQNLSIFGDGAQSRDFVYVTDVVAANLAAMESDVVDGSSFNIGTGKATTLNELAGVIRSEMQGSGEILHLGPRAGDILHSVSNPDRAKSSFGFEATVDLETGLNATCAYFKQLA